MTKFTGDAEELSALNRCQARVPTYSPFFDRACSSTSLYLLRSNPICGPFDMLLSTTHKHDVREVSLDAWCHAAQVLAELPRRGAIL